MTMENRRILRFAFVHETKDAKPPLKSIIILFELKVCNSILSAQTI